MKPGRPKRRSARQRVHEAQKVFENTGKYELADVLLTIGLSPENPPQWAVECCFDFAEREKGNDPENNPDSREGLDILLDQITRVYFSSVGDDLFDAFVESAERKIPSFAEAFRTAVENAGVSLEQRAVEKAWQKEKEESVAQLGAANLFAPIGLPKTPRTWRVFQELRSEKYGRWPRGPGRIRDWKLRRAQRLRKISD